MSKINWKHHFVEILVVIVGILIAFQLNQWSTNRAQKKLVDEHMKNLKSETKFNKRGLGYALKIGEANLSRIDSLIDAISNREDIETINRLSIDILNVSAVYLRKNAYTSLIESGDIRFIEDFQEKQDIINMYEYYKWTESFDEFQLASFNSDFYPYAKTHFDMVNGTLQEASVYFNKEYLNALATYRYSLDATVKKYKDCLDQTEQFLEKID